jgi:hypothetical protein
MTTEQYKYLWLLFELAPGVFYTYFYDHARRLRLEKLLYIELPRSAQVAVLLLKPPHGGFGSETVINL